MHSIRKISSSLLKNNQICFKSVRALSTGNSHLINNNVYHKPLGLVENVIKYSGVILTPLAIVGLGFFNVPNNHRGVIMRFGKYEQSQDEGLYWTLIPGFSVHEIFMGYQNFKLPESKVIDKNGNPIIISAVVNYNVVNPEKFVVNIGSDYSYIHNQAEAAIKRIASRYPYESDSEFDADDEHSLKSESEEIVKEMSKELQRGIDMAGININSIQLTDLNYAPEIAQQMLIKQQADAYIKAKRSISKASIGIVDDIVNKLGDSIDDKTRGDLIKNLLIVISAGTSVQPTLPMT